MLTCIPAPYLHVALHPKHLPATGFSVFAGMQGSFTKMYPLIIGEGKRRY